MENNMTRAAGPGGQENTGTYLLTHTGAEVDAAIEGWQTAQAQADATAADIAEGKKAITKDGLVTGTMQAGAAIPIVTTAGTGSAFTATIDGITELTIGMLITIIPHRVSSSSTPTLNINGLGAKGIRRRYSYTNSSVVSGYTTTWLSSGDPQLLQYDGTYWIAVGANKPYTSDLSSSVSVSKGGTGKTSWSSYRLIYPSGTTTLSQLAFPTTAGSFLRQGTSGAPYWTAPEDVRKAIGAASEEEVGNISALLDEINGEVV
ncbi:hypothetical protein [Anaeromassilibacillus sp. Marseille-P3371]|uniref:hypothetical protein n=1 Tax=Anaeromassilibacillus sp. Marseille-P3371 TaxID=1944639 RepID=UPI000A1CA717|nr:hypothetical protein [Anaeromassilibacillus sp. Marseille-P3371]